jgi:hypothetical protein
MRRRPDDAAAAGVFWGPGRSWATEEDYRRWVEWSRGRRARLLARIEAERAGADDEGDV